MRKRELSDTELQQVISLRVKGFSWLRIQREAGIPRHAAKRAYSQWESTKSTAILNDARKEVAVEEFRRHLSDLVSLAQSILALLKIPSPVDTESSSEINLSWMGHSLPDNIDIQARFAYKHQERLFKSLKEHTQEKIPWQLLEEWKEERLDFSNNLNSLHNEAKEILKNISSQEEYSELWKKIKNQLKGEFSIDILIDEIVNVTRQGKPEDIHVFQGTALSNKGMVELRFRKNVTGLRIDDITMAKGLKSLCKWTIKNLLADRLGCIETMRKNVKEMRNKYDVLEDSLNELILRPMILESRCKFCPA